MRVLISIFLYGFLLDAVLSVASLWLSIAALRTTVARLVFLVGFVLFLLTAFLVRLPKRFILPPFFFLVWAGLCGAFPLAFIMPAHLFAVLAGLQLLLAGGFLVWHRRWLHIPPPLEPRRFSWPGFASIAVLTLFGLPLALGVAVVNALGVSIEASSGGYVKLRPEGLLLEERDLAKDGKAVRLVSMMHIGEKNFYDRILESLPDDHTAVVLLEGVTDNQGLLKSRFSYAKFAKLFGLTSQEASEFQQEGKAAVTSAKAAPAPKSKVEFRSADVDISTFEPLTLEFINAIAVILSDPTSETILATIRDPKSPFHKPDAEVVVMHDIVDKRNDHLVAEIDKALTTSNTVIVPWGALHLSTIEAAMKERGFEETGRIRRPIIRFWKTAPSAK